jgi:hypothetical protein
MRWRVEGTAGVAQGTLGWPDHPNGSPSTLRYCSRTVTGGKWVEPSWETMWFPHAFKGVLGQLQDALERGEPPMLDAADNVRTMALMMPATARWRSAGRCGRARSISSRQRKKGWPMASWRDPTALELIW